LQHAIHGGAFNPAMTTCSFTIALSDANQVVLLPRIASLFSTVLPRARLRAISIDSVAPLGGLAGSELDVVIGPMRRMRTFMLNCWLISPPSSFVGVIIRSSQGHDLET